MSRKETSFGQLLAYVSRDVADQRYAIRHNLLAHDVQTITAEYEFNARHLPKRKNGVVMYHEILSITRAKTVPGDLQKEALRDIALDYIRDRAPECLVLGQLHDDHEDHLHYHLVISANPFGRAERHRLSRAEFRKIQVGLESRVLARYPQLQQGIAIGKKADAKTLSQKGIELERRTGKTPEKEGIAASLRAILGKARDDADLFAKLTEAGLELYARGKTIGVRDLAKGRNHRLATLGLVADYQTMQKRFGAAPSQNTQMVSRPPPAALNTHRPPPQSPLPIPREEPDMDLINTMLQGIGAVVDILSITRDTGAQLEAEPQNAATADHRKSSVHSPTPPPETDAERVEREHREEMEAIRRTQDAALRHQQDGLNLKR